MRSGSFLFHIITREIPTLKAIPGFFLVVDRMDFSAPSTSTFPYSVFTIPDLQRSSPDRLYHFGHTTHKNKIDAPNL